MLQRYVQVERFNHDYECRGESFLLSSVHISIAEADETGPWRDFSFSRQRSLLCARDKALFELRTTNLRIRGGK